MKKDSFAEISEAQLKLSLRLSRLEGMSASLCEGVVRMNNKISMVKHDLANLEFAAQTLIEANKEKPNG